MVRRAHEQAQLSIRKMSLLLGTLALTGLLLAMGAHWQRVAAEADPAAGQNGTAPETTVSTQAKTTLSAGGISAVLSAAKPGAVYGAGSSVFTEVAITNTTEDAKAQADLLLEAEDGVIEAVTGKNIAVAEDGALRLVRVGGLAKDRGRNVVVEVKTNGSPGSGSAGESRLKVTLRKPANPKYESKTTTTTTTKSYCRAYSSRSYWNNRRRRCVRWGKRTIKRNKQIKVPVIEAAAAVEGPTDSTVLRWPVSNCAQAFHGAIVKVREANAELMGDALKSARTRDRSRRGGWIFTPASGNADERKLNRLARVFVRARGIDPEMSTRRNYGWVSQKAASDLRGYLNQESHPAICTGAIGFVDFYDGRLKDFWARTDRFEKAAKDALAVAIEKIGKAREAIKAAADANQQTDAGPLTTGALAAAAPSPDIKSMIAEVAGLTSDAELLAQVNQSTSDYEALVSISKWLRQTKSETLGKGAAKAVKQALGAIEASEYLALVAGQYQQLRQTIGGSMLAIRDAHGRHCRCDS